MAKIKNIDAGPRGIWSKRDGRMVMIEPGQSVEVDVTAADLKDTPYFQVDGKLSAAAEQVKRAADENPDNGAQSNPAADGGVDKVYSDEEVLALRDKAKEMGLRPRKDWTGKVLEEKIAEKEKGGQ